MLLFYFFQIFLVCLLQYKILQEIYSISIKKCILLSIANYHLIPKNAHKKPVFASRSKEVFEKNSFAVTDFWKSFRGNFKVY